MRLRPLAATVVLFTLASTLVVGCKKPPVTAPTPTRTEPATPTPAVTPPTRTEVPPDKFPQEPVDTRPLDLSEEQVNSGKPLMTVYFAYDSAEFDATAVAALRANADWIKANSKWKIRIEGNCDERGTIKYNLALGQRRGNSVREYLASLGVPADKVRIVSYGEEKSADPGHDEGAWKMNRRADFWVEK